MAVDGHRDRTVDEREVLVGKPTRFIAEDPGRRPAQQAFAARFQQVVTLDVGGEHGEACLAGLLQHALELGPHSHRQVEDRAGGGPHDLGVVEVDTATGEDHAVCARGIRCPDDRAGVAGVANLFEDGDQRGCRAQDVFDGGRELVAYGHDALRGDGVGHGVEHVLGDELDIDAGVDCRLRDVGVPLDRCRGRIEFDDQLRAECQCLRHRLRSFEQEKPCRRPRFAPGELGHASHAG